MFRQILGRLPLSSKSANSNQKITDQDSENKAEVSRASIDILTVQHSTLFKNRASRSINQDAMEEDLWIDGPTKMDLDP